jgi:hypothetical protein
MSVVVMPLSVCGQHTRHTTVITATTSVARPVIQPAHIRSANERSGDAAERLRSARETNPAQTRSSTRDAVTWEGVSHHVVAGTTMVFPLAPVRLPGASTGISYCIDGGGCRITAAGMQHSVSNARRETPCHTWCVTPRPEGRVSVAQPVGRRRLRYRARCFV